MANILTGTDGVTSIPATRTLTSAAQDFVAAGVRIGDLLYVEEPDPVGSATNLTGDNNRYFITVVAQHTVTINRNWPVGGLTTLNFRVQRTSLQFSTLLDLELLKRMDAEAHRHLFKPRQWWVLDQLNNSTRNIYGEPKLNTLATASDGVTSAAATRTLTSAATDFAALGVRSLDNLVVSSGLDAGSYGILSAVGHTLTVTQNWPSGGHTAVPFTVRSPYHKYAPFATLLPFYVKLDPPEDLLKKYGIEAPRDALVVLSMAVLEQVGLTPKIGDRFDVQSESKNQQFEVMVLMREDAPGDVDSPLHTIIAADKCRYRVD